MRLRWLVWGLVGGLALAAAGLGFRTLMVEYPLGGLFMRLAHLTGVPEVFNTVHALLGYGPLAVLLAFAFYTAFGDLASGFLYATLFRAFALWVWRDEPARFDIARREAVRILSLGVLAVGALIAGVRIVTGLLMPVIGPRGRAPGAAAPAGGRVAGERIPGLASEATPRSELYYVSKNPEFLDPDLSAGMYTLELGGQVATPTMLTLDALRAFPAAELHSTLTCTSNPVGGELIGTPRWTGVRLATLLERARPRPEARWLVSEANDGYVESIPLEEVPPEAMVAYAINGEELFRKHGYPARLLLPGRYGMKQPEWPTRLVLARDGVSGYWAQRGWSRNAVIRTMSRIDTTREGARLRAGAAAGGRVQDPAPRDPLPDGATGCDRLRVRAA